MLINVITDSFSLLCIIHVSLTQCLHREALVEAAEHSTDHDQEACPHHSLILTAPGVTGKSLPDPSPLTPAAHGSHIGHLKLTTKNPSD